MARVLDRRLATSDVPSQCQHLVKVGLSEICCETDAFEEGFIARWQAPTLAASFLQKLR
jgi:hypothetical protein